MDWSAFSLSLLLAGWTCAIIIPAAVVTARALAWRHFRGRGLVEALIALPLVLPPTVLGYYLLTAFSADSMLGSVYVSLFDRPLAFTFQGLLLASVIFNIPFAVQPMQRAFESIAPEIREAAWCSGISAWSTFWRIELPIAWPGLLSALVLVTAHTLGEFGVVLMLGGNIPGETRTIAIAIYDRLQAFDTEGAGTMSGALLAFSFTSIAFIYLLNDRYAHRKQR
jgi:molybdate transport system permease protein